MSPKPQKGESLSEYVSEFMGDKRERKYKPKQRAAIAYSEYRESKKARKRG